jgi:hypothetical protein
MKLGNALERKVQESVMPLPGGQELGHCGIADGSPDREGINVPMVRCSQHEEQNIHNWKTQARDNICQTHMIKCWQKDPEAVVDREQKVDKAKL